MRQAFPGPRPSLRRAAGVLAALAVAAVFLTAQIKIPPSPDRWVTDKAGFLPPATVGDLDRQLQLLESASIGQFLIYIDRTTGNVPIEDFAVQAFEAWKPGRKGLDNGLILFIMVQDRKIRIEVGYGLEDRMTDAQSSRIINDILLPRIQAGDPDGAVRGAVAAIKAVVGGSNVEASTPGRAASGRRLSSGEVILLVIGALVFLIILITNPSLALWLLFNLLSGGRGGGGGGGGGFSGGGGRSGGGGASGGW
jgi:uncharacterized protein